MGCNSLSDMVNGTVKYWWISILTGILAIVLGILFILHPGNALMTVAMLFAIGFFVNGIFEIAFSIANRDSIKGWGWNLAGGIIDVMLGTLLLTLPGMTVAILIYFVGFWILFRSIWGIGASIDLQTYGVKGWGWLLFLAILGVLFSFAFIMSPAFGGAYIVAFAAIGFIFYGVFKIMMGCKMKSFKNKLDDFNN